MCKCGRKLNLLDNIERDTVIKNLQTIVCSVSGTDLRMQGSTQSDRGTGKGVDVLYKVLSLYFALKLLLRNIVYADTWSGVACVG
jgi:hypothetical protein